MMLYGVVLDGSQNSKAAFEMALSMMANDDQICLISVPSTGPKPATQTYDDPKQASAKAEILLQQFASVCDSKKVNILTFVAFTF